MVTLVVRKTGRVLFLVFENLREFPQKFKQRVGNLIVGELKVFTDEYSIYDSLKEGLGSIIVSHERVNHSGREFARGEVHVNTCENRHSFLRAYLRKYRGVSFRWLQGYLDFLALVLNDWWGWFSELTSARIPRRAKYFSLASSDPFQLGMIWLILKRIES